MKTQDWEYTLTVLYQTLKKQCIDGIIELSLSFIQWLVLGYRSKDQWGKWSVFSTWNITLQNPAFLQFISKSYYAYESMSIYTQLFERTLRGNIHLPSWFHRLILMENKCCDQQKKGRVLRSVIKHCAEWNIQLPGCLNKLEIFENTGKEL